jgi:hypothetical protein
MEKKDPLKQSMKCLLRKSFSKEDLYPLHNKAIARLINEGQTTISEHLKIPLANNSRYTGDTIAQLLLYAAINETSPEQGAQVLQALGFEVPGADDFYYHLGKKDLAQLMKEMNALLEASVREARKHRKLLAPVDAAIDLHFSPWYGTLKTFVVGSEPKASTSYFLSFATLEAVEKGERFAIAVVPVLPFMQNETIVRELISRAKKLVRLRNIYFDRWFYDSDLIAVLNRLRSRYVICVRRDERISAVIKDVHLNGSYVREHEVKGVRFTLVVAESDRYNDLDANITERYIAFATNIRISEDERKAFADGYRKRWSIETGYRVKKGFKISTSTLFYPARVMYFYLSCFLHNLWQVCNVAYARTVGVKFEKPLVTTFWFKLTYLLLVLRVWGEVE